MTQQETEGRSVDPTEDTEEGTAEAESEQSAAPSGRRRWSTRPPTEKVTGAQLEARFDDWSSGVRDKLAARTPDQNGALGRRVAAVALVLALIGVGALASTQRNAHEAAHSANAERIHQLEVDLEVAKAPVETKDVKAEVTDLSVEVTSAARAVATGQQRYAQLYYTSDNTASPGNGEPTQADLDIASHRRTLAKHFDKDSFQVKDDAEAYLWTSVVDVDPDKVDPRYEWYIRYDGRKVADPKSYTWQVETAMPDVSVPGRARVIWVCRTSQGEVLAWATAIYDSGSKVFDDLELVVTTTGQENSQTLGPGTGPKVPDVGDLSETPDSSKGDR